MNYNIVFSPSGSTKMISEIIINNIKGVTSTIDLIVNPLNEQKEFEQEDLLLVCMPVFSGRIPAVAKKMLTNLKGHAGPAIAVVVYGNRDFDDALKELSDTLREGGFTVIGAAAFIARHSIFPSVAAGRPDDQDIDIISKFGEQCGAIIQQQLSSATNTIIVKGNEHYCGEKSTPLYPRINRNCNCCGQCGKLCPVQAINLVDPSQFNKKTCISCGTCIYNCPSQAKTFDGFIYNFAKKIVEKKCGSYKKPELFYLINQPWTEYSPDNI